MYFLSLTKLTHAECVRVGHAGSDLHLTVRALGAGLTGLGGPQLLRKCSQATQLALGVSLWTTFADNTVARKAFGARCAQAVGTEEEEAVVAFTLRVLSRRASGQHGNTPWALGTGSAMAEVFR